MIKPGMFISDRYEIIEKVGSGGMADVYKAKCHRLNRYVAIKVLKPEFSSDKSFVNKFRGEAQSAAGLSHPNIVNVYDVGDDDGLHYIVMELVEGITLKRFIERKGKLEVKEAIGITIQIAQGMEAAHANHIIHRDIKPQNIIISKEGKVKVTDFGIAKATTSNTITSNAMGSVHYLSPEQARGGYSDEKSDIYSLGVTMYEMLSGQVPFAGDNSVSVALAHIQGEATPLNEIVPNIPHGVDMIVQKCMQKKPERRYLSASEMIVDLKKAIVDPDGDFVKRLSPIVTDSPTINLSDEELAQIKNSTTGYTDYGRKPVDGDSQLDEDEEDDDLDPVDPRVAKLLIGFGIPVAIIAFIVIIFLITKTLGLFGGSSSDGTDESSSVTIEATETPETTDDAEQVTVVSVLGMTQSEAEAALDGLKITYGDEDYSDEYDKGQVMSQSIKEGTVVDGNTEIILSLSAGAEPSQLGDYSSVSYDQAVSQLTGLGFEVVKSTAYSSTVAENYVISTSPTAGSTVTKGDTITVVVSLGKESTETTVPNLIGKTEKEARQLLEDAGLEVGEVTSSESEDYEAGVVKYQSYTSGQSVEQGTKVDFKISTGPAATPTPTVATTPTATPTPEETTENKTYTGTVSIDGVLDSDSDEECEIYVELEQDGEYTPLYDEYLTGADFPLTIPITSSSSTTGTVRVYVDGVKYTGKTWSVEFSEAS